MVAQFATLIPSLPVQVWHKGYAAVGQMLLVKVPKERPGAVGQSWARENTFNDRVD